MKSREWWSYASTKGQTKFCKGRKGPKCGLKGKKSFPRNSPAGIGEK